MNGNYDVPDAGTSTSNRRREERQPSSCTVELHLDPASIRGMAQDVSAHGLAFYADGPVRVVAKVVAGDRPREITGRLVRVESVTDDRCVLAVRFDRRQDPDALSDGTGGIL